MNPLTGSFEPIYFAKQPLLRVQIMRAADAFGEEQMAVPAGYSPLMDRRQFARAVGVSEQTVEGWIARRELPMVKIGRRNLVNVAAIHQRCVTDLAA
ncbi:helix-turn-helix domain-containing protein [Burkholderia territorii]|uniref:helix-turn-helix domain-containing protein n=1 Tax=Burkholderia territorii TaxID=1503055 RepID=UPI0018C8C6B7|nr:helix-turn-helix domain-containing protein [Burkholderia territorii]